MKQAGRRPAFFFGSGSRSDRRVGWHAEPAYEIHDKSRAAEKREQDERNSHDHGIDVEIGAEPAANAGKHGVAG